MLQTTDTGGTASCTMQWDHHCDTFLWHKLAQLEPVSTISRLSVQHGTLCAHHVV